MTHYQVIVERVPNENGDASNNPKAYLDTYSDESISLNYNIADINDLANKNSSYSKTINFPNTKNNQDVFSNIWEINMMTSFQFISSNVIRFDANKKTKAWILRDNVIQFEGNLQLTNIVYDYNKNNIVYQCVIYSENDGLFKDIGEKYLSDLDLSRFNHKWNATNILASWQAPYGNGYYYPMIDYGIPLSMTRTFRVSDFLPALYIKTIWDQIFSEAGYGYISNFLDSEYFSHLIMPYSNKNLPTFINLPITPKKEVMIVRQNTPKVWQRQTYQFPVNIGPGLEYGGIQQRHAGYMIGDLNIFNPSNLYNFTASWYEQPTNSIFALKVKLDFYIETYVEYQGIPLQPGGVKTDFGPPTSENPGNDSFFSDLRIIVARSDGSPVFGTAANIYNISGDINNPWGATNKMNRLTFGGVGHYSFRENPQGVAYGFSASTGYYQYGGSITSDVMIDPKGIKPGEKLMVWVLRTSKSSIITDIGTVNGVTYPPGTQWGLVGEQVIKINYMNMSIIYDDTQAVENSDIVANNILPNMKQKDFVANIIRMFNLYIDPAKQQPRTFLIEPRDDYYANYQNTRDWSDKLDFNKPIISNIASNTQDRTQYLTYKEDKDYYNTEYKNITNTIFGEYKYEFENEFSTGEKKIELIFSPTPTVKLPLSNATIIPSIYGFNNGNLTNLGGFNTRILYAKTIGLTGGDSLRMWTNGFNVGTPATLTTYPFASFSDDPFTPTTSLNFGTIQSFYSGYDETINNLYYTYWQNTLLEINGSNARIVEAYFNLTSYDINQFSFADLVYCTFDNMAGWYRVNKIMDYDPSKYDSTKVQLIKALNYSLDIPFDQGDCALQLTYCLCGSELQDYIDNINLYYETIYPYVAWNLSGSEQPYTFEITSNTIGPNDIMSWFGTIPGATASFTPGSTACSLTFQLEMGEESTITFGGSINQYYEDNVGSAYLAIYIDYPCGASYGTWVEGENVWFWDVNAFQDQYSILDWWIANIPGAYGTASGNPLAEQGYLQLGMVWDAPCLTQSYEDSVYYTINLDSSEVAYLVEKVNDAYGSECPYLTFWTTYAFGAYNFTASTGNETINDIITWGNTIFGMSASLQPGGGARFYYRQDGQECDTCDRTYTAKLTLNDTIGSPAVTYVCETLFTSEAVSFPCVAQCFGEGLQVVWCYSNIDYLPGGWTPELFCDGPLLNPYNGPVYDAGDLTYSASQSLCYCEPDQLCFTLDTTIECPGGTKTLTNYISDATGEESDLFLWETADSCECPGFSLPKQPYSAQSTGFRTPPPLDNATHVGVLNTSRDNLVTAPNVVVLGSNNNVYAENNIVVGNDNGDLVGKYNFVMGSSISTSDMTDSPSILVGKNIYNEAPGSFVFGNNISISQPVGATGPTGASSSSIPVAQNLFVIGSNLSIGSSQSLPPNTTFLGTENIIISQDGGFNTPFIISEEVSTTENPTGQTMIKTYTGYALLGASTTQDLGLWQFNLVSQDDYYGAKIWSPFFIEVDIRAESTSQLEWTIGKLWGGWYRSAFGYIESIGIGTPTADIKSTSTPTPDFDAFLQTTTIDGYDQATLTIDNIGVNPFKVYWTIKITYQYE